MISTDCIVKPFSFFKIPEHFNAVTASLHCPRRLCKNKLLESSKCARIAVLPVAYKLMHCSELAVHACVLSSKVWFNVKALQCPKNYISG